MKITYDSLSDAVYLYLQNIQKGQVAKTCICDFEDCSLAINIDLDTNNQILGIEILDAGKSLGQDFINNVEGYQSLDN